MAIPGLVPALIGAAGSIAGGLMGGSASSAASDRAAAEARAMREMLDRIQLPDIEKQKLLLELPQIMGQYTPEMEQYHQLGPSAMQDIQLTPEFQEAQMTALQSLQDIGQEGMTASERAVMNQIRRQTAQEEQARQNAILQNMAERGVGGSGIELAARLSSSQASADRASQESDRLAAMAQQRALESIQQAGGMATQLRGQEFGEQSASAKAKDVIDQFNIANRQSLDTRNVGSMNQAQLRNLQEQQRLSELQSALRNQQQMSNKALDQQRFQNELSKASGQAGVSQNLQSVYNQQATNMGNLYAGIGTGIGKAAGGVASLLGGKGTDDTENKLSTYNKFGSNLTE
jgi:hypothetical protein